MARIFAQYGLKCYHQLQRQSSMSSDSLPPSAYRSRGNENLYHILDVLLDFLTNIKVTL